MEALNKLGKSLNGKVLTIGFSEDNKLNKDLKNNKSIELFYEITNNNSEKGKKKNRRKFLDGKKNIDIKKLKKYFKKQKFDYIICDFETIRPYFRSFVKNSILLSNKKIYLYINQTEYEIEEIEYRYNRYECKSVRTGINEEYIIEINTENSHLSLHKIFLYKYKDLGHDFVEFIANILIGI